MRANDPLLLRLGEHVHCAAISRSPIALGNAVDEHDIDVIDSQLFTEAVEVGADTGGVAGIGLGKNCDLVAWNMLQTFGDIGMAPIGVCSVEEAQAVVVVTLQQKIGEG